MEKDSKHDSPSIMNLPDDCLYFIFHRLQSSSDCKSFGLTCHRLCQIQNSSRKSLEFECSFSNLNHSSLSHPNININSYILSKLLNRFRQLESLSLSGCVGLPDSGLTPLLNSGSKMHTLNLDCCLGITDSGLSVIASGCPSLQVISLYRCNISDFGLEILAKSCLALKDVNLSWCKLITDHGIRALSKTCRQLQGIRISNCDNITGIGFEDCSQTLTHLEAESCKLVPEGIFCIVSGGGLEYLNVSSLSWSIRGDGLRAIGSGFANRLKILNFRLCRTVNDETVMAIVKGCRLLQEWNLSLCNEIKLRGWESIGEHCYNLERLHVNGCRNLCDQGLQGLRSGCKRLSVIYITRCHLITSLAIELFKCFRGDVQIKHEEVMCIAPNWAFR